MYYVLRTNRNMESAKTYKIEAFLWYIRAETMRIHKVERLILQWLWVVGADKTNNSYPGLLFIYVRK